MGDKGTNIVELIRQALPWTPVEVSDTDNVPTGDMPGDKAKITPQHIAKSRIIFPKLLDLLMPVIEASVHQRAAVAVCGGSGVGKSEIASLISLYLNRMGIGAYTLSGDNYPHRIPKYNDAERLRVFRTSGTGGLIAHGQYSEERRAPLKALQAAGEDANPEQVKKLPWLALYQRSGRNGLQNYLGTSNETDFAAVSSIVSQFQNGASTIFLKRMGREETELWFEPVDFSDKHVLVLEWTHGNNRNLQGIDIPILLNSTPQETLEHRRSRNRDGATDSPFTMMVLGIEQDLLVSQASQAKLILSKDGEILTYREFLRRMLEQANDDAR
jgi:alpha-galactosidase